MTKPNDGGPAFPVPTISGPDLEVGYPPHVRGMSLRDWFAGQAPPMPNMWAARYESTVEAYTRAIVEWNLWYADAMLAAREAR